MKNILKQIHPLSFVSGLGIGLLILIILFGLTRCFSPNPGRNGPRGFNGGTPPTMQEGKRLNQNGTGRKNSNQDLIDSKNDVIMEDSNADEQQQTDNAIPGRPEGNAEPNGRDTQSGAAIPNVQQQPTPLTNE